MVNPRRFPDSELVERNPKLAVDALYRTGSLFMGQIYAGRATGSR